MATAWHIIAHPYDATFARRLLALKLPVVNVTSTFLDLSVSLIDVDNHLVGRMQPSISWIAAFETSASLAAVVAILQAARGGISP